MADTTISQLDSSNPNKDTAVIPYSDGSSTYKTSPAGIVAASPGTVLNIVQSYCIEYKDVSSNATVWQDLTGTTANEPGLQCTITPKNVSNKILVQACINWDGYTLCPLFRLLRNNTSVGNSSSGNTANGITGGYGFGSAYAPQCNIITYLDGPNLTIPLTYKVQVLLPYNSGTFKLNRSTDNKYGLASSLTLTEIAG